MSATRAALFLALLAIGLLAVARAQQPGPPRALPGPFPPAQPGTFPAHWSDGTACASEPALQVHAYNEDLYILRQGPCSSVFAPFLYLFFGADRALLLDTGAPGAPAPPVAATVLPLVTGYMSAHGLASYELVVAHSHDHPDHTFNDAQFAGQPLVTYVPPDLASMQAFFGFTSWPDQTVSFDLGERVIDLIPTPGHQAAGLTLYDRRTHLLFTGDLVFPGHLYVFTPGEWPAFTASIARAAAWSASHPVKWVLGGHVEMSTTPGVVYPFGSTSHPAEHPLQLAPEILGELDAALAALGGAPACLTLDECVLQPVFLCGL